jgi:hypothetical protein
VGKKKEERDNWVQKWKGGQIWNPGCMKGGRSWGVPKTELDFFQGKTNTMERRRERKRDKREKKGRKRERKENKVKK